MRRRLSGRGLCELFLRSGLYDRRRDLRSESEFESELELEESEESESLSDDEDTISILARSSIISFWAFCNICEYIFGELIKYRVLPVGAPSSQQSAPPG